MQSKGYFFIFVFIELSLFSFVLLTVRGLLLFLWDTMKMKKIKVNSTWLFLALSAYFAFVLNYPLYAKAFSLISISDNLLFFITMPFVIFFALNAIFQLLCLPYLHKLLIPLFLILSAAISYQEIFYGIYFDAEMLNNVLQTNFAESVRLVTLPYILWIIFLGIIPAIVYLLIKVNYRPLWREIVFRVVSLSVSLLMLMGIAHFYYQDYASFLRNNKSITHLIVPSNFVGAGIKKYKQLRDANRTFTQVGLDSKQDKPDRYRHVTIFVLGETTRAQNWGLNGYNRQTTPLLAARNDIVNFKNVSSCGTATSYSVPCIFSNLTRVQFNNGDAPYRDNLLDILQRAGVKVVWFDNDSGCKEVCNRVENYNVTALNLDKYCHNGECLDELLFEDLDKTLHSTEDDMFIVLHTIGSHGPTYYERYPSEFRKFTPTCDTNLINQCSDEQLINTYDNTILYVDYIVNKAIQHLEKEKTWESAVLYVSDHGESLGENGVYMHSAPYAIAPQEQTKVPMVMWFSEAWNRNEKTDMQCLQHLGDNEEFSHDNLFHSIIALFDMDLTLSVYDQKLDILSRCKIH